MLSSCHKLLFIKCMRLIGVAFNEPDLDRLDSMCHGEIMATNKAVMQEDPSFRQIASTCHLERQLAVNAKTLDQSSASAGAITVGPRIHHVPKRLWAWLCHISAYPLLSAYCRSVYRYKRMRLLTRVYGRFSLPSLGASYGEDALTIILVVNNNSC